MAAKISSSQSQKSLKSSSSSTRGMPSNKQKQQRKSIPRDHPSPRSSIYRGVTRHRWTGRYEAHLWDKNCWNESQTKKGRQVYLGAYDDEDAAARAYDLAALKYWGQHSILNFPLSNYEVELKEMENQSKQEYIGSLRRKSSGFSRGVSKYRGVARHHHNGRWEARIGRVFGNKYLYLGTYATQEEAATAYDMAAIEYRGLNAVTNFDLSRYIKWLRPKTQEQAAASSSDDHNPDYEPDITTPQSESATATSPALGLLLQSSKFKEMLDISTTCAAQNYPLPQPQPQPQTSNPPRRTFPQDIQTFFESQDSESDDIIFGELSSIAAPIFHCELDS